MKQYAVKEIFATLQGEGINIGTPSVFVRFAGCNLWSGQDSDRDRDAERNQVQCPRWCDTDFRQGEKLTADQILTRILRAADAAKMSEIPLLVFTGGEPLLQLDTTLVAAIRGRFSTQIAIETNGVTSLSDQLRSAIDWICVSPKAPAEQIVIRRGDELKVVYPAYDPLRYQTLASGFSHRLVQPQATTEEVGKSAIDSKHVAEAVQFCISHPRWRISYQLHKALNLP